MRSTRKRRKSSRTWLTVLSSIAVTCLLIGGGLFVYAYVQDGQQQNSEPPASENDNDNGNLNDSGDSGDNHVVNNDNNDPENNTDTEPDAESYTDIRIAAAGDIMFHDTQLESALDEESGAYDFNPFFEDVQSIFSEADLAMANFETTTAGSAREYTGYPIFNSPDETIDAVKNAGIDVLTHANNHSLDTGSDGLKRTAKMIREKGLSSAGSYVEKPDSRVLIEDVKGIKVAILAYTESTNGLGSEYPDEELNAMLNLMRKDIISEDIQEAKDEDADIIIASMHWGIEYDDDPNETQIDFAQFMAEEGVDIILGSHPHVIQKSELIETDDQQTFVIYSMGNFISNQRQETLDDERTEDGIIVNIDIQKNDETGETNIKNIDYVPTWVYRNKEDGDSKYTYRILPIENFLDATDISKSFIERMEHSLETTISKMEDIPFEAQ